MQGPKYFGNLWAGPSHSPQNCGHGHDDRMFR